MKLPLELVDVLNWRERESDVPNPTSSTMNSELVDQFFSNMYSVYDHMIQFGVDYHNFMDRNDPIGLLVFIDKYKNDDYWRLARFANGLNMDLDAVRNTLLYPDISNGIVEGINSIIKSVKRVCGGKAKIDLLTAKMLIRHRSKSARVIKNTT